jgi:hypothetical protein
LTKAGTQALPQFPVVSNLWHDHVLFTGNEVTGIVDFAMRLDSAAAISLVSWAPGGE